MGAGARVKTMSDDKDQAARDAEELVPCDGWSQCTNDDHPPICHASLREAVAAALRARDEQIEVGHQISGSFFEALKPLQLSAINVANPGQHVTDLIAELAAMRAKVEEQAREITKLKNHE